jgi:hypothetical protein
VTGPSPARLLRILRRRLVGLPEVPERGGREAAATVTRPVDPPQEGEVEQR